MLSLDQIKKIAYDKLCDHPSRLKHTIGVANMAQYLGNKYNCDINKCLIAAYLHDLCKYDSEEDIKQYLTTEEIAECEKFPFLYHAYGASYKYLELGGKDIDIFNAIHNHVFGRRNMSLLEEIIMISDYTEENRKYEDCIKCREILLNKGINNAILYSLEKTINHIIMKGEIPHPEQIKILEEYKGRI